MELTGDEQAKEEGNSELAVELTEDEQDKVEGNSELAVPVELTEECTWQETDEDFFSV